MAQGDVERPSMAVKEGTLYRTIVLHMSMACRGNANDAQREGPSSTCAQAALILQVNVLEQERPQISLKGILLFHEIRKMERIVFANSLNDPIYFLYYGL